MDPLKAQFPNQRVQYIGHQIGVEEGGVIPLGGGEGGGGAWEKENSQQGL